MSTFLSDYHKLRKIIAKESNIQEDIVTSKITKNIIEQNNEIIVDVNRYKESYYTVNHVKNDYLTYESSDYRFVFSKDTGELIDYIPGDMEEKTLMKSASMDRIIESEHKLRNKLKIKEETQSVHRTSQFESKKRIPSAEYRKVSVFYYPKFPLFIRLYLSFSDFFFPAHIHTKRLWNIDTAVFSEMIFQKSNQHSGRCHHRIV